MVVIHGIDHAIDLNGSPRPGHLHIRLVDDEEFQRVVGRPLTSDDKVLVRCECGEYMQ